MDFQDYPGPAPVGFAAGPIDRAAHLRVDASALGALRDRADARVLPLWRYRIALDGTRPAWLSGELPDAARAPIFLGLDDGVPVFAADVSALDEDLANALIEPARYADLRMSSPRLAADDAALLAYARAMVYWQRQHRHCGRCGAPTEPEQGGHVLACRACEVEHYPRSDPSMLVLVTAGERCLLGRQASWPAGVWSTLAGFVEPGESFEDAVLREVWEEARIRVTGLRYYAGQPWPFPASVLAGFHAEGIADTPQTDQDELEAADWFTRERIAAGVADRSIYLPPPVTMSFRLIEHWFDLDWPTPLREMTPGSVPRS